MKEIPNFMLLSALILFSQRILLGSSIFLYIIQMSALNSRKILFNRISMTFPNLRSIYNVLDYYWRYEL